MKKKTLRNNTYLVFKGFCGTVGYPQDSIRLESAGPKLYWSMESIGGILVKDQIFPPTVLLQPVFINN